VTGDAADESERRGRLGRALRSQADWCGRLESPLYAALLARSADDCEAGGPTWRVLEGREDDPGTSALALRFMGAVHRLALAGEAPALAAHYPSAGGEMGDEQHAWSAFRGVLEARRERLRAAVLEPVQTNEVGRCAGLLGGFLALARETGFPLRLLEIGASAGLNLRFDRYRYEGAGAAWGDPGAGVRLLDAFEGPPPDLRGSLAVASRAGCDARPLDPDTEEGRLTLRAFLWPDQVARRARLDGALAVAARVPARVERADACDWLERALAPGPEDGAATVVFHSIVLQYLGVEGASRLARLLEEAGARARASAPLAWLRLEPVLLPGGGGLVFRVLLTRWPGGRERVLAACSPHGPPVSWLDEESRCSSP
jgi:hypothetical protein